jgi:hypothetical protein
VKNEKNEKIILVELNRNFLEHKCGNEDTQDLNFDVELDTLK